MHLYVIDGALNINKFTDCFVCSTVFDTRPSPVPKRKVINTPRWCNWRFLFRIYASEQIIRVIVRNTGYVYFHLYMSNLIAIGGCQHRLVWFVVDTKSTVNNVKLHVRSKGSAPVHTLNPTPNGKIVQETELKPTRSMQLNVWPAIYCVTPHIIGDRFSVSLHPLAIARWYIFYIAAPSSFHLLFYHHQQHKQTENKYG